MSPFALTRRTVAFGLAAGLPLLLACETCKVYCPQMLTVVFLDRAGAHP